MRKIMLDLETLGNEGKNVIIQIGACEFDIETGEIGNKFKLNVDAASAVEEGGMLDARTVYWWLSQDKAAINSVIAEPRVHIRTAFAGLNEFLRDAKQIWSHATFDFVTINNTFKMLKIDPLYSFRAGRDIRTLIGLANVSVSDFVRAGTHHDALDDCIFQVQYCVAAYRKLRGIKK